MGYTFRTWAPMKRKCKTDDTERFGELDLQAKDLYLQNADANAYNTIGKSPHSHYSILVPTMPSMVVLCYLVQNDDNSVEGLVHEAPTCGVVGKDYVKTSNSV
ncbi:hypothetical protein HAX54_042278 [Datura stramonium]|uniref:Uncharacterized protein n=1 Tax=Datura stramonium TaxID=4076 RepID=A0ABS8W1L6_DATST|nr:hypothetical protein [Datura stramonium]